MAFLNKPVMIKVAMITRSTMTRVPGGDTIQVQQTARALEQYGVSVDIRRCDEPINYSDYQLLHFFNITRPADILCHVRRTSKPFVLSTIFVDYSEFDKYHRAGWTGRVFRYLHASSIEYVKSVGRWVLGKDALVSTAYLWKGHRRSILEIIDRAALLLPNSASEHHTLADLHPQIKRCVVVPNGVDTQLFSVASGVDRDPLTVLCVARIEGLKNQLNLIRALNNTSFRLVIVGEPAPGQLSYYKACRKIAAPNVWFTGHLPQKELVYQYSKANVHVLPSWFETTGLSSLEAGAMGCRLVITDKGYTRDYFGDHAVYCDPSSPNSIYAAVEKAASLPHESALQSKINSLYTWDQAGRFTAEGYKRLLNEL